MNQFIRKYLGIFLAGAAVLSMTACGKGTDSDKVTEETEKKEWVYVPEFLEIEDSGISYYDMQYQADSLYYTAYDYNEQTGESCTKIKGYSLTDKSISEFPVSFRDESTSGADGSYQGVNLNQYQITENGELLAVISHYTSSADGSYSSWQELKKYDSAGEEKYALDLREVMGTDSENYLSMMLEDSQGRVYLAGGNDAVWLVDENGNAAGQIETPGNGWVNSIGAGRDGNVYLSYYDSAQNNTAVYKLDFEKKAVGDKYENFLAGSNSSRLCAGVEKDFLVQDGTSVYEYDLSTQTTEKLFDWLDSEINGYFVNNMGVLSDGRILAVVEDWSTNESEIALLTKTPASQVTEKEQIVIGSINGGYDLQALAVKFNRSNDKYHISIRQYMDYNNWTETSMSDAVTVLNNDLVSGKQLDIIDLSGLDMEKLAEKGLFEDLSPYLEKSQAVKRENFLQNILDAYTCNEKLIGIPATFTVQTVIGPSSELGTKTGWTMADMIAYADKHPDAAIFASTDQQSMLYNCMMYSQDSFIDWGSQSCNFNNQEFKDMLEFISRFPEEYEWKEDDLSEPSKIQKGYVLLSNASIYNFNEIQVYNAMFGGDINCIGFPTADGSAGSVIQPDAVYAISVKSGVKDAAWSFLEFYLDSPRTDIWGFPTDKTKLEKMAAEAVKVEYVTDAEGKPLLDENGEPIAANGVSSMSYQDGWSYTYHQATQEEVDTVMGVIEEAKPATSVDTEIQNIILEEAAPFFKGQKTVDEVAGIIQNRVQTYVNENS